MVEWYMVVVLHPLPRFLIYSTVVFYDLLYFVFFFPGIRVYGLVLFSSLVCPLEKIEKNERLCIPLQNSFGFLAK